MVLNSESSHEKHASVIMKDKRWNDEGNLGTDV